MNEKLLYPPKGVVDIILDTDAYNEIDDQFAISYMLKSREKFNVRGICAAPFFNENSTSPADGMKKSYDEILTLLKLADREELCQNVFLGSEVYLPSETEAVKSDAAEFVVKTAREYSAEKPLYIAAIGAITNVASALLLDPTIKDKCVVVWLGGHALHMPKNDEFNLKQDIAAARVVFGCGVPLVQLPCNGVVDQLRTTEFELRHWLGGKSPLCDHLVNATISAAEGYAAGKPWSRVIWDISTIAWFWSDDKGWMNYSIIPAPMPSYDHRYEDGGTHKMAYVYQIDRDAVFDDMFKKLTDQ